MKIMKSPLVLWIYRDGKYIQLFDGAPVYVSDKLFINNTSPGTEQMSMIVDDISGATGHSGLILRADLSSNDITDYFGLMNMVNASGADFVYNVWTFSSNADASRRSGAIAFRYNDSSDDLGQVEFWTRGTDGLKKRVIFSQEGDLIIFGDNKDVRFGLSGDSIIYYDAASTDMKINPDRLGSNSGILGVLGSIVFETPGKGLPYGECFGDGIAWSQASAVQNTWYPISDADMTSGELNLVTHDGNGQLTLAKAGVYKVDYDFVWETNIANKLIEFSIEIDSSGSPHVSSHTQTEAKFANMETQVSHPCLLTVTAGQTINAMIRTTSAGTPNIIVDDLHIVAVQVGG